MLKFSLDPCRLCCKWLFIPSCLATAWLFKTGPALSLWSLSHVSVLDMPVSLTGRGCPLYSCMSTLIHSHLWMSSPAGNPHQVTSSRINAGQSHSALFRKYWPFPLCFYLYLSKGACIGRNKVSISLAHNSWGFERAACMNASGRPCDPCQSVTAGIWHHSTSTSLSLRLRPLPSWLCTRKLVLVIRTDS